MLGVVAALIQAGIVTRIKLYSEFLTPRKVTGGIGDGRPSILPCCSHPNIVQLTVTTLKRRYCSLIIPVN